MPRIIVDGSEATLGRDPASTVFIADPHISRTHLVLRRSGDGWSIKVLPRVKHQDLVRLGAVLVAPGAEAALGRGDRLQVGPTLLTVVEVSPHLVLEMPDETEGAPAETSRLRLAAHPHDEIVGLLEPALAVVREAGSGWASEDYDGLVVRTDEPEPWLVAGRQASFFLPLIVLGDREDLPSTHRQQGACYLWIASDAPDLSSRIREAVVKARRLRVESQPHRTAEILHLNLAARRVMAHDWIRGGARALHMSELQQEILVELAQSQRERSRGMALGELADRLADRGMARSIKTLGNELSNRLRKVLEDEGVHPHLLTAAGTREKTYELSTPPTAIRDV